MNSDYINIIGNNLSKNNSIEEPKNAEEYARLPASDRFSLKLKWAGEELMGGEKVLNKLIRFDKPLSKIKYHLVNKKDGSVTLFDNIEDIGMEQEEIRYLKRYGKEKLKVPKYDSWYTYYIESHTYILVGDEYIKN